jgi:hypothetical protein
MLRRWTVSCYDLSTVFGGGGAAIDAVCFFQDGGYGEYRSPPSCGCFHHWVTGTSVSVRTNSIKEVERLWLSLQFTNHYSFSGPSLR